MVDRKIALLCTTLVVLMFGLAFWQIITPEQLSVAGQNGATAPSLFLLLFPASSALFVGVLYWSNLRARANAAKLEPWRKWGAFLSISYCGGLLLIQVMLIIRSLNVDLPVDLWSIGRTLAVMLPVMCLLAINQAPKLPHFERRWNLGPIYGPRYIRAVSRSLAIFMIAVIAYLIMTPAGGRSTSFLFSLAAAFLMAWSIAWRIHLARRWKREQSQSAC